ncbi:creatine kinase B-type-like [Clytia hemisphaerica]|uniref:Creatine kinase n=1 Tax=Clytia hemisphaerica TaxID=252671 RepID=A0A7M5WJG4_9CNID
MSKLDPNWVWASGGLAAGCILTVCVSKITGLFSQKAVMDDKDEMDAISNFNNQVTTFSDITMLVGTPFTSAHTMTTSEYLIYPAEKGYPKLEGNRTIMARYLTQQVYEDLFNLRTSSGCDFDTCIQTGIDCSEKVSCGLVAGDEECYDLFSVVFDPVISDRHRGFGRGNEIIGQEMNISDLKANVFDRRYVKSIHFLVGRCIKGFRFPPTCRRAERRHTEKLLKDVLLSLEDNFEGSYHHLVDLSPEERYQLPDILQSVTDAPISRTLISSGSTRDWPCGRGVFYSQSCDLFAWTNREDHLRIMYRDRDMDIVAAFKSFTRALEEIKSKLGDAGLEYSIHKDYGHLLTCPSGIGTALRAGVHLKLPNLICDPRFRTIIKNLRLHMGAEDQDMLKKGYVDVYNMDRLGYSEVYLVQRVADAVDLLIKMEQRLEHKQAISQLITKSENFNDDLDY